MGETLHNDAVYVAVSQDVRESKSTLSWTLRNFQGNKIFLLHVYLPCSFTPSSSGLTGSEIEAIQESELRSSYDSLHKYRDICTNKGVREEDVDIACISGHGVCEGIVELIYQNNIKKLVMGAAADPHYSRGMSIASRKAEYVSQHAPNCCTMWFICKGRLIQTREGRFAQKQGKGRRRDEHENQSPKKHSGEKTEEPPKEARRTKSNKKSEADSSSSPPRQFICPIKQGIMRDPHVAADGFSYEADQIRTWLKDKNRNSPATLKPLDNHNIVPNHNLGSLINEWLHQHPNYDSNSD